MFEWVQGLKVARKEIRRWMKCVERLTVSEGVFWLNAKQILVFWLCYTTSYDVKVFIAVLNSNTQRWQKASHLYLLPHHTASLICPFFLCLCSLDAMNRTNRDNVLPDSLSSKAFMVLCTQKVTKMKKAWERSSNLAYFVTSTHLSNHCFCVEVWRKQVSDVFRRQAFCVKHNGLTNLSPLHLAAVKEINAIKILFLTTGCLLFGWMMHFRDWQMCDAKGLKQKLHMCIILI